jgi:uncharacterized protein with PQ loop repeat
METGIIGYVAASTSVIAFGTQFIHTVRCGTVEGISLPRTMLDAVSLTLWVVYATRLEDIPLLIATSFELVTCLCLCGIVLNHYRLKRLPMQLKVLPEEENPRFVSSEHIIVDMKAKRRNSI